MNDAATAGTDQTPRTPLACPLTAAGHGELTFRILGPVEMWYADRQCDLPPGRASGVLAILLLTPRITVPTGVLAERLWDGRLPEKARENLSAYVTRLRGSLRRAAGDGVKLIRRSGGYVLDVDPGAVDLHQFRHMRRLARALADSNDRDAAIRSLRSAEVLWTGQALAGVRGDWFARIRGGLEDERRVAIAERVECELQLGRHSSLVGELGGLLAEYPLDETFIGCMMTALYRSGRTSDALALYRQARSGLAEELGAEPGPILADLHLRILRGDPGLAAPPGDSVACRLPTAPAPGRATCASRRMQGNRNKAVRASSGFWWRGSRPGAAAALRETDGASDGND